ncbi:YbhB/YbcL family Raf kinase inhibitor-like protein [Candidatus Methylobacter oryzae]|uniref:YbhB/YbcL family Raf kinase inhibitor-like protein n=1 Tax=Candidatus Methylobacter oryzae TaxID=2497749 RepID=A0ABY3C959_9GAMM|nr:YbhB/YbcL family Raf kinase inhibitor-like protein [Candidatus Methylobacter oryzae]TRW93118.1 YbhB/YbcL family Raf kinase inhibitor-like protein [Candidatus Methylobacter oryzae]
MSPIKQLAIIPIISSIFFTTAALAEGEQNMTLSLKSADFADQGEMPKTFTCDGNDTSPALSWSGVPQNAKSLVLIVDDPDAPDPAKPKMTWVHWVLYNIPPTATELPRSVAVRDLPAGTLQGKNDWKQTGYRGPCPPTGRHRYFHKLYALNIELPDLHQPKKSELEKAMEGHVIEHAELIGTYQH